MTVAVVGLGKIGLPLAVAIAGTGERVIGLDVDERAVASILGGHAPFPGEPELDDRLQGCLTTGSFVATSDASAAVSGADTVIVVVPLVVDTSGTPDFSVMDAATDTIGPLLRPGVLVSYETTLPVGATRSRFAPRLVELSGLRLGEDLFVCHSPERVSSGRVFADLRRYPKLVGGVDEASEARAEQFYAAVLAFDDRPDLSRPNGVWPLGGSEAAELAKLAETTYRDVNIAFANELAIAAEGIGVDVRAVIEACNSQPFSHIHDPGIWVGGHCIPVYPHLLMSTVSGFRLPLVAREVNVGMARHAVDALAKALGGLDGAVVVVLGLAFRGGVKEDFYSGAYALVRELAKRGATAVVHDPLYAPEEIATRDLVPYELGTPCDAAILHTAHEGYSSLDPAQLPGLRVMYDGRRALDTIGWEGVQVIRLGAST